MDEHLGLALMPPRVAATVVSAFAVLALLLAAAAAPARRAARVDPMRALRSE